MAFIKIALTRDSFCMGDDALAPNKKTYEWAEGDKICFFSILEDYIGCNLPGYYWRGFAGGKQIADVNLHREDLSVSKESTLVENWDELLRKSRSVYIIHTEYKDKDSLPSTLKSDYSSFEDTEDIPEYNVR